MTLLRAALFLGLGVLSPLVEEVDPKVGLDTIDEDDVEAHLRFLASRHGYTATLASGGPVEMSPTPSGELQATLDLRLADAIILRPVAVQPMGDEQAKPLGRVVATTAKGAARAGRWRASGGRS